jgi:hypothetical protein
MKKSSQGIAAPAAVKLGRATTTAATAAVVTTVMMGERMMAATRRVEVIETSHKKQPLRQHFY